MPTYITLGDAIDETARRLSLVNAPGMTAYSDDFVTGLLVSAHELLRGKHEFDELIVWQERTLDGVVGKTTQLVTATSDWKMIRRIYHESFQTPLAMLSSYVNTLTSTLLLGYRALAPVDDVTGPNGRYLVQFYPATLTGRVVFQIELTPTWTSHDEVMPIDFWWHVYAACWMWTNSDASNQQMASMYQQLMAERMMQITAKQSSRHAFSQPNQMIPNEWFEADAPYQ